MTHLDKEAMLNCPSIFFNRSFQDNSSDDSNVVAKGSQGDDGSSYTIDVNISQNNLIQI